MITTFTPIFEALMAEAEKTANEKGKRAFVVAIPDLNKGAKLIVTSDYTSTGLYLSESRPLTQIKEPAITAEQINVMRETIRQNALHDKEMLSAKAFADRLQDAINEFFRDAGANIDDYVSCLNCSAYVPKRAAYRGGGKEFCSDKCRTTFAGLDDDCSVCPAVAIMGFYNYGDDEHCSYDCYKHTAGEDALSRNEILELSIGKLNQSLLEVKNLQRHIASGQNS